MHAAEQVLLRLQPVEPRRSIANASARAESRARSAASWLRCARGAGDRRDRCRRRARWRRFRLRARCADCVAASVSASTRHVRARLGRGDVDQPLAQLVEARRRDLVEHLAAPLLPLVDHGLAHAARWRAPARRLLPSSSASNSSVTSSSRTGPSARVMRRTRRLHAIERVGVGARAQHRQRFAQPSRRDARLVHGGFVARLRRGHGASAARRGVGEAARRRGPNAPC